MEALGSLIDMAPNQKLTKMLVLQSKSPMLGNSIKSFRASVRPHKSTVASASAQLPGDIGSTKLYDEVTSRESGDGIEMLGKPRTG